MTITRPIISAKEFKQTMIEKQSSTIIIDARGGADALARYQAGHLKGAIFMDLEQDLSVRPADPANGGRHPLPTPQAFGDRLGRAGISPDAHVLVYDDKAGANAAARFWWMMRAAGHENVKVIDGGLEQLRLGLPLRLLARLA